MYVHFDKPFYMSGEVSWYKVYVITEPNLSPDQISSVINLDWIDPLGNLIKHQRLKIENGGAAGDFTLDTTLSEGIYTVRAYTNWMRNEDPDIFFSKRIQLFSAKKLSSDPSKNTSSSKIDCQFFAEGGTLVSGINTQVGFKAINAWGKGVNVQGKIVDDQGAVITSFKSIHNGMGTFPLTPEINRSYRAITEGGEIYPLPLVSETGLTLSAYNMNTDKIFIRIQSSKEYESSIVYLIGQSQAAICYAGYIKLDGTLKDISISKNQLQEGILQLTLFNSDGIPQCERKVFIKKDSGMVVTIQHDKEKYLPRDSIILTVKVRDSKGNAAITSLSVSVTDENFVTAGSISENIYTGLLLQSDIKGKVENPLWYFNSQSIERRHALDLVMLTHGWSGYNWKKILAPEEQAIAFLPENGISLAGKITENNKPVSNTPFILTIAQAENNFTNIYETDSLGQFNIPDLDFVDSSIISFRVMSRKGVMQNAKMELTKDQNSAPIVFAANQFGDDGTTPELSKKLTGLKVWEPDKYKLLKAVVVTGQVKKVRNVNNSMVIKPDARDIKTRLPTLQFISRYAIGLSFATFKTMPDDTDVWGTVFRGKFTPIRISINGVLAETTDATGNPYYVLNSIPIEDIEQVVIGRGGGIAVWTKKPSQEIPEAMQFKVKGYDAAREFYHPKYSPTDSISPVIDNRVTLYWNPNLQTDRNGMARIKFYNTDHTQTLHIVTEGISNGLTISNARVIGKR